MKRTPKRVSEERQSIGREIAGWQKKIADLGHALLITPASRARAKQQVAFCEQELKECRKRMAMLRGKGRKTWTFKTH